MIDKLIDIIANWFYKQIKKESWITLVLLPFMFIIGIFVCIYEEWQDRKNTWKQIKRKLRIK